MTFESNITVLEEGDFTSRYIGKYWLTICGLQFFYSPFPHPFRFWRRSCHVFRFVFLFSSFFLFFSILIKSSSSLSSSSSSSSSSSTFPSSSLSPPFYCHHFTIVIVIFIWTHHQSYIFIVVVGAYSLLSCVSSGHCQRNEVRKRGIRFFADSYI